MDHLFVVFCDWTATHSPLRRKSSSKLSDDSYICQQSIRFAGRGHGTLVHPVYYIKQFLINLILKKNGIILLLEHGEKRKETVLKKQTTSEKNGIVLDRELKPPYIGIDGQVVKCVIDVYYTVFYLFSVNLQTVFNKTPSIKIINA